MRSDTTTRNKRKAATLAATYDALEERIARLRQQEELDAIRPDLDGTEIMAILGIKPGPLVGKAYKHLLELRMENGPLAARRGRPGVAVLVRRPAVATAYVRIGPSCSPVARTTGQHDAWPAGPLVPEGTVCGRRGRSAPR